MSKKDADARPEFASYKAHPILSLFPAPTDLDLQMMEHSVAKEGVIDQIVAWEAPNGHAWLIDGRTRQGAAERAFAKKVDAGEPPVAENGRPLQPEVFWFEGTLEEVYAFISKTHIRKNYTQGQKCAMVVKQHYYEYKQAHGGRLPSLEDELAKEGAVTAEMLAARAGGNIHYARICRRLYRERPDLLDSVAMAVTSPGDADKLSKKGGAAVEEDKNDPEPPTDPEIVRDASRQEVPKNLEDAFRGVSSFRVVQQHLEDAISAATKIAGTEAGVWFDLELFTSLAKGAQLYSKKSAPHLICEPCAGKGRERYARVDCERCKGSGYVSKSVLEAEKKAAKSGGAGVAEEEA